MEKNLNQWKKEYEEGKFESKDVMAQIAAGWFDWFCKDESLANKTKKLAPKVLQLMKSPKIDCEKCYVFFKNNCPCSGTLYDSFSICDIESGEVLYWIAPKTGYYGDDYGKAEVSGKDNMFKTALVKGTWRDVKKFFEV